MSDWKKVKINSFLKERESRIKPAEANKMGLKRLNKIDFSGKMHLLEKPTNTDMILIQSGDLVISGINIEKGAVAVYQGEENILATIHYSAYIFDETEIDIEYFKTFLKSKAFRNVINSQIRSGIKTELKAKKFLLLEINLPDLETQIEIRNKINLASDKISEVSSLNNKNESHITKLRQQILKEAVQGKLVKQDPKDESTSELLKKIKAEKEKLIKEGKIRKEKPLLSISEDEIPYELPKGWEWCRLGEIAQSISDGVHYAPNYLENGIPCISAKDVYNHKINLDKCNFVSEKEYFEQRGKFLLKKNSLLVTKSGSIGRTAIFDGNYDLYAVESIGIINFNYFLINPAYIQYLIDKIFDSITYDGDFVRGLGVKHLTLTLLGSIPVPLPPLPEQKRIVEKVDKLMAYCDELEKRIKENSKNSKILMGGILKEAFENGDKKN